MGGFIRQPFGVPLDGDEQGECRVFQAFYDSVGRRGDDAESSADAVDGLFMIGVGGDFSLADGFSQL